MKVQTPEGDVYVRWQYGDVQVTRNGQPIFFDKDGKETTQEEEIVSSLHTKQTQCIASRNGEEFLRVSVNLYHRDVEDKELARKYSLDKLLRTMYPSPEIPKEGATNVKDIERIKAERKEASAKRAPFWDAYTQRKPAINLPVDEILTYLIDLHGSEAILGKVKELSIGSELEVSEG